MSSRRYEATRDLVAREVACEAGFVSSEQSKPQISTENSDEVHGRIIRVHSVPFSVEIRGCFCSLFPSLSRRHRRRRQLTHSRAKVVEALRVCRERAENGRIDSGYTLARRLNTTFLERVVGKPCLER